MAEIGSETCIQISDECMATTVEEEVVVLNHKTGTYEGIAGIGTVVWELATEPSTVSSILEEIEAEFEGHPDGWREEVLAFIEELSDRELIEVVDEPNA